MNNKYVEEYSDVNVEGIEFYVKEEADGYLYKEATCENKVTSAELKHAFEMADLVIVDGDYKYRPEIFGVVENVGTVAFYNKVTIETVEEVETITLTATKVMGYDEPVEVTPEVEETETPEEETEVTTEGE